MSPPVRSPPNEGEAQQHHVRDKNGVALARHDEGSSREGPVDAHAEHGVARPLVRDLPHGVWCGLRALTGEGARNANRRGGERESVGRKGRGEQIPLVWDS
mgnify:CR=1 FL=1